MYIVNRIAGADVLNQNKVRGYMSACLLMSSCYKRMVKPEEVDGTIDGTSAHVRTSSPAHLALHKLSGPCLQSLHCGSRLARSIR